MIQEKTLIVPVLSGKGGVGKSTVSSQLAMSLSEKGFKVGLLDLDLTGPSIARLFNVETQKVIMSEDGWTPIYVNDKSIRLMSIAFLLNSKLDAVIWRGPKKNAMIKQFIENVNWGDIDYLIIDTCPGTSDEHLSMVEYLTPDHILGAILVTTPQSISLQDVRKEIDFCEKTGLKIIGLVENMSGFICPHCAECTDIFSSGGGQKMASDLNLAFLGRIPLDPTFNLQMEGEKSIMQLFRESNLHSIFLSILDKIIQ